VLIAQEPRLSGHIQNIRNKLSEILNITADKINISATTTEFLGLVGGGNAIACGAVCALTQLV
jgi:2-C-methyl-D-erythritol 2,4-cyclodiphosphate synthase